MKSKSFSAQFKGLSSHVRFDFPRIPEHLSPKEKREILVKRKKQLDQELSKYPMRSNERSFIGAMICELNEEISLLRKKFKGTKEMASHFINVARENLSKAQFDFFMKESIRRSGLHPVDDLDENFKPKEKGELFFK